MCFETEPSQTPREKTRPEVHVSPAFGALLKIMAEVGFGRIEGLHIREGNPVLSDPPPRVVRTIKFGPNRSGQLRWRDLLTRPEVRDLLTHLARLGDGLVQRLEFRDGLPCFAEVEQADGSEVDRAKQ